MKEIIKAFCDRYFNYKDREFFRNGFIFGLGFAIGVYFTWKQW